MTGDQRPPMASHSPGPWTIGWPIKIGGYYAAGSGAFIRAADYHMTKWPVATCSAHTPNWEADARLIAAAPDMLAALKAVEEIADYLDALNEPDRHYAPSLGNLVRAAIAKAEVSDA